MRSQASKPCKKGVGSKTSPKSGAPTKQVKKKNVMPKKVKTLIKKSLLKLSKKKKAKNQASCTSSDGSSNVEDRSDTTSDTSFVPSSKSSSSRSDSPTKKIKREPKEKKETFRGNTDSKKVSSAPKKTKKASIVKSNAKSKTCGSDDVKYKLNNDFRKSPKCSKTKAVVRKVSSTKNEKIKSKGVKKQQKVEASSSKDIYEAEKKKYDQTSSSPKSESSIDNHFNKSRDEDNSMSVDSSWNVSSSCTSTSTDMPNFERPPKFFTSFRSPRTVDIDVKCCKTSKGNLSVSERFLSKNSESEKSNTVNKLISQGPDIDVYTFSEKVDSPKSTLSDFINPSNKNIGRVRPIARVKGTVIDKKAETERKKYSPHRPIEEVVKQLKANKRSDDSVSSTCNQDKETQSSSESNNTNEDKDDSDNPLPIISKSYKMVARKSSIPGKPFSPLKLAEQDSQSQNKNRGCKTTVKKSAKSKCQKSHGSDDEFENSKFSLSSKSKKIQYSSSDESVSDSNDDNDTKESSESDSPKSKKNKKAKKYKRSEIAKTHTSKELRELSKDCLTNFRDDSFTHGKDKHNKRRLKLMSMWCGPKKHRMASLNAIAKVHCLYENESRTHLELGLMRTLDRQIPVVPKPSSSKKKESKSKEVEQHDTSESEFEKCGKKDESSEEDSSPPTTRTLRGVPGIRSAGKYWDPKSSTSSSEDSELDTKRIVTPEKKKSVNRTTKSDSDKSAPKMKKTVGVPVKKKRSRNEVTMDLKDMVVQKRMASLNATAILAASYEKRSPKSNKDDTTSDSCSDESFSTRSKNGVSSGVKSESKIEETKPKKEIEEPPAADRNQKVEVIVNQDTDVTITGVYSTHHHEGFCTVSGMQYRISSTSHTQTTATANCEKERCVREDGARYTPLSALSSMQPPAEHAHPTTYPAGPELGGLSRRAAGGCSAFSAPAAAATSAHHEPGYYQPAGPLIKENSADAAERSLARYQPPPSPHYHTPHPPVMQQFSSPYYPAELCYGRYYRPGAPPGAPPGYMPAPPPADPQMVGVSEPYPPPPQYYGSPPCYQHSPQRVPYIEYRGCSCPINSCPKNVLIGPATGKAPAGGGPADVPSARAPSGGAFRAKVRAVCSIDTGVDAHGSGKDPPLEAEPPAAADAPRPCFMPSTIGGASPKRELYEARDKLRLSGVSELPNSPEVGPPSPARGSAGACAPQPPPAAPRRARLGKDMARRSLAGDDTGLLLAAPPPAPSDPPAPPAPAAAQLPPPDADRATPLLDVKKENDGPTAASPRKPDALALREHNCSATDDPIDPPKPVKRRYSRPNLEIDMREAVLEDTCKTNGIGEHVKLQKRRKVSNDQSDIKTDVKEIDKKSPKCKKLTNTLGTVEKKIVKRKRLELDNINKKLCLDTNIEKINVINDGQRTIKPKTKSALLLDNLLRKNSIDRADSSFSRDKQINPAELFLPTSAPEENCAKPSLNINNNVIDNGRIRSNVRPTAIAAVAQLFSKKPAVKNVCKLQNVVESKVSHKIKTVPKVPTDKLIKDMIVKKVLPKQEISEIEEKCGIIRRDSTDSAKRKISIGTKNISEDTQTINKIADKLASKALKCKSLQSKHEIKTDEAAPKSDILDRLESKDTNGVKDEAQSVDIKPCDLEAGLKLSSKRCKLAEKSNGELKAAKLLESKKSVEKCDTSSVASEESCGTSGTRGAARTPRGGKRRRRRPPPPPPPPDAARAPPRWSNGWHWDGEPYISKVFLNNDSRLDRTARCWPRMRHASGDLVARGDCVLLRASAARAQPFVARVEILWENPDDGEMMVSLVWYYRPEHTERGRQPEDAPDEVFASRHRDANSVACIEDKCHVLTYDEYCRYRKRLRAVEEGITPAPSLVPPPPAGSEVSADAKLPPAVAADLVLFCRKIYDFRSKKIQVPNK